MVDDTVRFSRLAVVQYELLLGLLVRCRQLPGWSEEDESNLVAALDVSFDRLSAAELSEVEKDSASRAGDGFVEECSNYRYTSEMLRLTKALLDATERNGKPLGIVLSLVTYPCGPHGLHCPVTVATGADEGKVDRQEVEFVVRQLRMTANLFEKKYAGADVKEKH